MVQWVKVSADGKAEPHVWSAAQTSSDAVWVMQGTPSGATYYWNKVTGEMSFEPPESMGGKKAGPVYSHTGPEPFTQPAFAFATKGQKVPENVQKRKEELRKKLFGGAAKTPDAPLEKLAAEAKAAVGTAAKTQDPNLRRAVKASSGPKPGSQPLLADFRKGAPDVGRWGLSLTPSGNPYHVDTVTRSLAWGVPPALMKDIKTSADPVFARSGVVQKHASNQGLSPQPYQGLVPLGTETCIVSKVAAVDMSSCSSDKVVAEGCLWDILLGTRYTWDQKKKGVPKAAPAALTAYLNTFFGPCVGKSKLAGAPIVLTSAQTDVSHALALRCAKLGFSPVVLNDGGALHNAVDALLSVERTPQMLTEPDATGAFKPFLRPRTRKPKKLKKAGAQPQQQQQQQPGPGDQRQLAPPTAQLEEWQAQQAEALRQQAQRELDAAMQQQANLRAEQQAEAQAHKSAAGLSLLSFLALKNGKDFAGLGASSLMDDTPLMHAGATSLMSTVGGNLHERAPEDGLELGALVEMQYSSMSPLAYQVEPLDVAMRKYTASGLTEKEEKEKRESKGIIGLATKIRGSAASTGAATYSFYEMTQIGYDGAQNKTVAPAIES